MSSDCIIVFPPKDEESSAIWMSVSDGGQVRRALSPDRLDVRADEADSVIIALPVAMVTVRTFDLPHLSPAQGNAVARRSLLDTLLGGEEEMHVVAASTGEEQTRHVVTAVSNASMRSVLSWAHSQGIDPDCVVPAGLLLPEIPEGFVRAIVGREIISRGNGTCLPGGGPIADAVMEGKLVIGLEPHEVQAAIAAAAMRPIVNLRTGPFARKGGVMPAGSRLRRWALMVYGIVFLALVIMLAGIGRTWLAVRDMDAQSLDLARQILPQLQDAALAERELDTRLARAGAESRSFTGLLSGLFRAMKDTPTVTLTLLSRTPDGLVNATLVAPRAQDIDAVVRAVQNAGYGITSTSSSAPDGRVMAQIVVAG